LENILNFSLEGAPQTTIRSRGKTLYWILHKIKDLTKRNILCSRSKVEVKLIQPTYKYSAYTWVELFNIFCKKTMILVFDGLSNIKIFIFINQPLRQYNYFFLD